MILHAAHLRELFALRHVVMDEPQPAVQRHGDGHAGFRDRVHVGGDDGDVKLETSGERDVELGVARQHLGVKRRQRDVIERQADLAVGREKFVRCLIERSVEWRIVRCCHDRKCRLTGRFGKKISDDSSPSAPASGVARFKLAGRWLFCAPSRSSHGCAPRHRSPALQCGWR